MNFSHTKWPLEKSRRRVCRLSKNDSALNITRPELLKSVEHRLEFVGVATHNAQLIVEFTRGVDRRENLRDPAQLAFELVTIDRLFQVDVGQGMKVYDRGPRDRTRRETPPTPRCGVVVAPDQRCCWHLNERSPPVVDSSNARHHRGRPAVRDQCHPCSAPSLIYRRSPPLYLDNRGFIPVTCVLTESI